jgi:hypothetical protein
MENSIISIFKNELFFEKKIICFFNVELTLGYGNDHVKSLFDCVGKKGSQLKVLKRCIVLTKHICGLLHNKKKITNCFTSCCCDV